MGIWVRTAPFGLPVKKGVLVDPIVGIGDTDNLFEIGDIFCNRVPSPCLGDLQMVLEPMDECQIDLFHRDVLFVVFLLYELSQMLLGPVMLVVSPHGIFLSDQFENLIVVLLVQD